MAQQLLEQVVRRDFAGQARLLAAMLANPCQTRQFIARECGAAADEFSGQYAVLSRYGAANQLQLPVVKQGRLGERSATVFMAFPDDLLCSVCRHQLAGVLPRRHAAAVQGLVQHGTLWLRELAELDRQQRTARQQAAEGPPEQVVAALVRHGVVRTLRQHNAAQRRDILLRYLRLNGYGQGARQPPKRQAGAPPQYGDLPADLQLVLQMQAPAPQDEEAQFALDHAGAVRFLQLHNCVQTVARLADAAVARVAAQVAYRAAQRPGFSFTAQDAAQWEQEAGPEAENLYLAGAGADHGVAAGDLRRHLQSLVQLGYLVQSFDRYSLDRQRFADQVRLNTVCQMLAQRYSREAGRVVRYLGRVRQASLEQVEYGCVLSRQHALQLLNNLHRDGFVQMLTAGRAEWSEKAVVLYAADEAAAVGRARQLVCQVVSGLIDCREGMGAGLMTDDAAARASQLTFGLVRMVELLSVLL